jgi:hypothetical protein
MSRKHEVAATLDPEVRKYEEWRTLGGLRSRHTPENPPEATIIDVIADPTDRMITTRQAAVVINMSEDTLRKWRVRKRGPRYARYHDGTIRYSLAEPHVHSRPYGRELRPIPP